MTNQKSKTPGATRKIILIGEAPTARIGCNGPFDGTSGRRLAGLAELSHADFLDHFECVNLVDDGADNFDVRAARGRADQLRKAWHGRKVVLLGRGVAAAFRLVPEDYDWFKPIEIPPGIEAAIIPHPGGIASWWNDPKNIDGAREFMLRAKLGFLTSRRTRTNGRKELFTPAQVAAALEAGRGVYTWAAEALADATGISCSQQTIKNYCNKYPELEEYAVVSVSKILDRAKKNIIADIEAGGVDSSWKLLRSRVGQGSGFELVVHAKHEGQVEHSHQHSGTIEHKPVEALEADTLREEVRQRLLPPPKSVN